MLIRVTYDNIVIYLYQKKINQLRFKLFVITYKRPILGDVLISSYECEMKCFTLLIAAAALFCGVQCSKILLVFPVSAPSHYILGSALAKGLAAAGHNITMISAFGEKTPPKNVSYRDIVLTGFLEERKSTVV